VNPRFLADAALTAVAALSAAACGSGAGSTTSAAGATTAQSDVKACLVSDVGRFNDKGFNQLQYAGPKKATFELGVQQTALESKASGDYIPNLSSCARAGNDVTIAPASSSRTRSARSRRSSRSRAS
jgi:basic membrane protein A